MAAHAAGTDDRDANLVAYGSSAPARRATSPRYPTRDSISGPARPPPRAALPSLDQADAYVENALIDLLGRKAVQSFLHLDGFARNFVATVNNLGTDNAAAQMWPVKPTPG